MTGPVPQRILVAVEDSPAAMAGVRVASGLAAGLGARLRFVHVLVDGELVRALTSLDRDHGIRERQARAGESLLARLTAEARAAGLSADSVQLEGEPAPLLLDEAGDWEADLVVLGRADVHGAAGRHLGSVAGHVLELSECPVLVVTHKARDRG